MSQKRIPASRSLKFALSTAAMGLVLWLGAVPAGAEQTRAPTAEDARTFVEQTSAELKALWIKAAEASWNKATNITEATIAAESEAMAEVLAAEARVSREAARFNDVKVDESLRRQLDILKRISLNPAPADEAKIKQLAEISSRMEAIYGKGQYCKDGKCLDINGLSEILEKSRDYDEQLEAWTGWHAIAPEIRPLYEQYVALVNEGARELGYKDAGDLWRSGYDMSAEELSAEVDRLWQQVSPLYEELHCYVRAKLVEKYGADKVPADGPIPAHLLGNMWAQQWNNVYDIVAPYPEAESVDVTPELQAQGYDAVRMARMGEAFFSSLGFEPLPETFWERSMLVKPEDREVVCHASAWSLDFENDLRIKMCTRINQEDLITIHHELGHNYYQRAYNQQPVLFQGGANDGFHEAIGDAIALSVTPQYLQKMGLLKEVGTSREALINEQMSMALDKIAFLPFGRLMDEWRWQVFSGETGPEDYNKAWWELREKYQGVAAPVARTEEDFDPGAKYHIPAGVPYLRYFLSFITQFQFHKGLCEAAGHKGPLHTCSIYNNKEAGKRFAAMMAMGASRPWPEALEVVTGSRKMDGSALIEYFEPLRGWLKEANKGRQCGWKTGG